MDSRGNHHGRGGRGCHRGGHRGGRGGHHGPGHHGHHDGPPGPGHHGHHGHHKKHHGPGGPHGFGPGPGPGHFPHHKDHGGHFPHHKDYWEPSNQGWEQPMEYVKPQEVNVHYTQVTYEPIKQSIPVQSTQKVEIQQQHQTVTQSNVKEEDQFMCGICESEKKNSIFDPCMHLYACEPCAKAILEKDKRCPICMKSISGVKKIFIA